MVNLKWEHLSSVVSIKLGTGATGTGFILYDESWVYLVTAAHVLFDKDKDALYSDTVEIHQPVGKIRDGQSMITRLELDKLKYNYNLAQDYFVVRFAKIISGVQIVEFLDGVDVVKHDANGVAIALDRICMLQDVQLGEEVMIVGYPSSVGLKQDPQFDYNVPLLQRGIVSNIYDRQKTIILDSSVYPGNSGSLVLVTRDDVVKAIGMVLRYIPYEQVWYNTRDRLVNREYHISRFSVALSFDVILANLPRVL